MELITNINWSDPITIAVGIGVIVVIGGAGYLWWAWSEGKMPFDK